jgi:hypothetical protein
MLFLDMHWILSPLRGGKGFSNWFGTDTDFIIRNVDNGKALALLYRQPKRAKSTELAMHNNAACDALECSLALIHVVVVQISPDPIPTLPIN